MKFPLHTPAYGVSRINNYQMNIYDKRTEIQWIYS